MNTNTINRRFCSELLPKLKGYLHLICYGDEEQIQEGLCIGYEHYRNCLLKGKTFGVGAILWFVKRRLAEGRHFADGCKKQPSFVAFPDREQSVDSDAIMLRLDIQQFLNSLPRQRRFILKARLEGRTYRELERQGVKRHQIHTTMLMAREFLVEYA